MYLLYIALSVELLFTYAKLVVSSSESKKIVVIATFDYYSVLKYHNCVGVPDR